MKKELKIQREMQKILDMAKAAGHDVSNIEANTSDIIVEAISEAKLPPYWDAEATLALLCKPIGFMTKNCRRKSCENIFGTSYKSVGYCSDYCRVKALANYGIKWDPTKTEEERWGGESPLIVPSQVLKLLLRMAKDIQEDESNLECSYPEGEPTETLSETLLKNTPVQPTVLTHQTAFSFSDFESFLP